ncbi:hypothetical protein BGZ51_001624 [Haplosporangium sp. Z 767]|nr:hypothetical protein BGZ51_001624 [Haplosporangium sp. Z 767]
MNTPSDSDISQWIWNNAVGERELYSNCADIEIKGRNGGYISGAELLYTNYDPDSIRIPEFDGLNSSDGSEAFAQRK